MYAALQSSDATFAYSSFYWGKKKFASQEFDSAQLQKENYIHMTALILRECISELDESITKFQDWDTWLTMLEQGGHGKYIPKYLFSIITGGTISSWLPSFCYKAPFKWIPGISSRVKKYEHGKMLIQKKHSLSS